MNGRIRWQKITMCGGYLGACVLLGAKGLAAGADPTGLGVMFGGMAAGVASVIWGNVQEHRAASGS